MPKTLRLPDPTQGIERIAATLNGRLQGEFELPSFKHLPRATREAARRFWSYRAWTEYAALPMVSQITLKLAAQQAPLEELTAASGILHDEALHTALSVQVAEAFGGYVEDIPDYLQLDVGGLAQPSAMPLAVWLVVGCCIGETVSRALIQARLQVKTEPAIKALITRTLKDENVHVAFDWAAAKRAASGLSKSDRASLVPWCEQALRGAFTGPSTRAMRRGGQRVERRQRRLVAEAGLVLSRGRRPRGSRLHRALHRGEEAEARGINTAVKKRAPRKVPGDMGPARRSMNLAQHGAFVPGSAWVRPGS